jgi:hypothetical protein
MTKILAWHFVGKTLRDGRPIPADGEVLRHDDDVKIRVSGLHASERILDALQYAQGHTVCRVECDWIVDTDYDKLVCRERTILWRVDAEDVLRAFARRAALDVIHLWDAPDVVRKYLETGDESLRSAAMDAASSATWTDPSSSVSARAAAMDAARAAAWAASSVSARAAAMDAVRAAAWAASSASARAAAMDAVRAAAWAASSASARAAARAAARDAAGDRYNGWLSDMVEAAATNRGFAVANFINHEIAPSP